ncbi:MAG: ribosome assembly RNA-binding protein YhbY [Dokdonella sp.]
MSLSKNQIRHLRGLAHVLNPVILMGQKGLTDGVLGELDLALSHHELVKVKLTGSDRDERAAVLKSMLDSTGAELVQSIGHTASLFRRNTEQPKIALPK